MRIHNDRTLPIVLLFFVLLIAFNSFQSVLKNDHHYSERLDEISKVCSSLKSNESQFDSCVLHSSIFAEVYIKQEFSIYDLMEGEFKKSELPNTKTPFGKIPFRSWSDYFKNRLITKTKDLEEILLAEAGIGTKQTPSENDAFSVVSGLIRQKTYVADNEMDLYILELVPKDDLNSDEFVRIQHAEFGTREMKALKFCTDYNISILERMNFVVDDNPCFGNFVIKISNKGQSPKNPREVTLVYAEINKNSLETTRRNALQLTQSKAEELFSNLWLSECRSMKNGQKEINAFKSNLIFSAACSPSITYTSTLVPSHAYAEIGKDFIVDDTIQSGLEKSIKELLPKVISCESEFKEILITKEIYQKRYRKIKVFKNEMEIPIDSESSPKNLLITFLHECPNESKNIN